MNGLWDFVFLGDVSANSIDVSSIKFNDSMAVPACFDATPTYAGRRGKLLIAKLLKLFLSKKKKDLDRATFIPIGIVY
jgi:hypothetical protein